MIRTTQNFELFLELDVNHFCQSVDAILKEVSVTKTIACCYYLSKDFNLLVFQKLL